MTTGAIFENDINGKFHYRLIVVDLSGIDRIQKESPEFEDYLKLPAAAH
tara:strand:- start:339 stop:485 length:147 start_codon:yes stop_codon:yes gene_type:complete